jgi:hypothetical protein
MNDHYSNQTSEEGGFGPFGNMSASEMMEKFSKM